MAIGTHFKGFAKTDSGELVKDKNGNLQIASTQDASLVLGDKPNVPKAGPQLPTYRFNDHEVARAQVAGASVGTILSATGLARVKEKIEKDKQEAEAPRAKEVEPIKIDPPSAEVIASLQALAKTGDKAAIEALTSLGIEPEKAQAEENKGKKK